MRSDNLNWYNHSGYTEMTALSSNVNVTNENKSKHSIDSETLWQSCSTNEKKPKRSIVNKPLAQNVSADMNELCSKKKDESECANKKQNDAKNEVACDVTKYFNISNVFECRRKHPDVSCERAYMATEDNEYFTDIHDTLNKYQDRHGKYFQ